MLKRWAALPRGTRWLTGIAAAVLALAFLWALFGPLADWLARQDVGSARGSLHETAVDNARGRLLTLGAGLVALAALVFTARTKLRPAPPPAHLMRECGLRVILRSRRWTMII